MQESAGKQPALQNYMIMIRLTIAMFKVINAERE